MKKEQMNYIIVALMILASALTRLAPHPANFTPVTAMALFAAVYFARPAFAFIVPLGAMLLSDLFLGFTLISPVIYAVMLAIACGGLLLKKRFSITSLLLTGLASSLFFFVTTNFAVWAIWDMYPKTLEGLVASYTAALPFYRNMAAGDLFYGFILFASYALAIRPALERQYA